MKTITSFNNALIEYSAKERMLKPLALYYLVKAKFNHSIIFNYTPNKLAKMTGLHHKTVVRYVKRLMDEKLVEFRDGHLTFKKSTVEGFTTKLPTAPYTSFEGILDRIHYIILINNKAKQAYNIAVKYGHYADLLNARARKKAIRNARIQDPTLESITKPVITVRNASKLFNTSIPTAANIINSLEKKKYLKLKGYVKIIGRMPKSKYHDGSYFASNGLLFRYLGRIITIGAYLESKT